MGHLEQEVLPPRRGDDLDADGQAGGLVVVDGEEIAGWPVTLKTDVNTPIGPLFRNALRGSSSVPVRQAPTSGGRQAIDGVTRRSKPARRPSTMRRDNCCVLRTPSAYAHESIARAASRRARLCGSTRSDSASVVPAPPTFHSVVNAVTNSSAGGSGRGVSTMCRPADSSVRRATSTASTHAGCTRIPSIGERRMGRPRVPVPLLTVLTRGPHPAGTRRPGGRATPRARGQSCGSRGTFLQDARQPSR